MVLRPLLPGGEGSTATPFSQGGSTSYPTGHRTYTELMWCVGKGTRLTSETWLLCPARHQPVETLGKPFYLINERSRIQLHRSQSHQGVKQNGLSPSLRFLIPSLWSGAQAAVMFKNLPGCSNMQPAPKPLGKIKFHKLLGRLRPLTL